MIRSLSNQTVVLRASTPGCVLSNVITRRKMRTIVMCVSFLFLRMARILRLRKWQACASSLLVCARMERLTTLTWRPKLRNTPILYPVLWLPTLLHLECLKRTLLTCVSWYMIMVVRFIWTELT
uniref:Uncharacterized protein n=1 Tax=Cacopsylla melanoneura TaxID=428564 RepID=A0A8D8ZYI1_9HEMI